MEPKTKTFEPLKIRLSEGLDARLRSHAEKTGATLNSIICLAVDKFLPDGSTPEKLITSPESVKVTKSNISGPKPPTASQKPVPKPLPVPPKLGPNPTKAQRNKLAKWHKQYGGTQGDLLSGG